MLDRRRLIAALAVLAAPAPLRAANRAARINWPGGTGRLLHGVMAIPEKARGRQSSVLVVGDTAAPDQLAAYLVDRIADAGLIACAIDLAANKIAIDAPAALDDALATIGWLGGNAFATGKVGAIGLGRGATLVRRLAVVAGDRLTAAVALGGDDMPAASTHAALLIEPLAQAIASGTIGSTAPESHGWEQMLVRATAFLKEHLA